jgi:hypothetical protein
MLPRSKYDSSFRPVVIALNAMAAVGALASLFVILVRVPAMSTTKLEALFGTLQGVAVALLFAVMALLIDLIYMVYRANRPQTEEPQV